MKRGKHNIEKTKHGYIIDGIYALYPLQNAFNDKISYWMSKDGYSIAVYCFSSGNGSNVEDMLYGIDGYIKYCEIVLSQKCEKTCTTLPERPGTEVRYIKKAAVIEAIRLNSFSERDVETVLMFMGQSVGVDKITQDKFAEYCFYCKRSGSMSIKTPEGDLEANVGDYIIRGADGYYYPCNPETFEFLKKFTK